MVTHLNKLLEFGEAKFYRYLLHDHIQLTTFQ